MVYGHSPAWKAHTGLDTLSYCDRYLCELYDGLAKAGILERALIVVVADHGDRFRDADPNSYRVPLLVAGRPVPQPTKDCCAILTWRRYSPIILRQHRFHRHAGASLLSAPPHAGSTGR